MPRTVDPTIMPYMGIRDLYTWKRERYLRFVLDDRTFEFWVLPLCISLPKLRGTLTRAWDPGVRRSITSYIG